jgi:hypothetical protein
MWCKIRGQVGTKQQRTGRNTTGHKLDRGTGGGAVRNSSVTGGQGGQVRTASLHIQHVSEGLAAQRQRGDNWSFADENR